MKGPFCSTSAPELGVVSIPDFSHPRGCAEISLFQFELSSDARGEASSRLDVLFGEVAAKGLRPVSSPVCFPAVEN